MTTTTKRMSPPKGMIRVRDLFPEVCDRYYTDVDGCVWSAWQGEYLKSYKARYAMKRVTGSHVVYAKTLIADRAKQYLGLADYTKNNPYACRAIPTSKDALALGFEDMTRIGLPSYYMHRDGRVWSNTRRTVMKPSGPSDMYQFVKNKQRVSYATSTLLQMMFGTETSKPKDTVSIADNNPTNKETTMPETTSTTPSVSDSKKLLLTNAMFLCKLAKLPRNNVIDTLDAVESLRDAINGDAMVTFVAYVALAMNRHVAVINDDLRKVFADEKEKLDKTFERNRSAFSTESLCRALNINALDHLQDVKEMQTMFDKLETTEPIKPVTPPPNPEVVTVRAMSGQVRPPPSDARAWYRYVLSELQYCIHAFTEKHTRTGVTDIEMACNDITARAMTARSVGNCMLADWYSSMFRLIRLNAAYQAKTLDYTRLDIATFGNAQTAVGFFHDTSITPATAESPCLTNGLLAAQLADMTMCTNVVSAIRDCYEAEKTSTPIPPELPHLSLAQLQYQMTGHAGNANIPGMKQNMPRYGVAQQHAPSATKTAWRSSYTQLLQIVYTMQDAVDQDARSGNQNAEAVSKVNELSKLVTEMASSFR